MKKVLPILSLVLVLILSISLVACNKDNGTGAKDPVNGLSYSLQEDGTYEAYLTDDNEVAEITVAAEFNGKAVTAIKKEGFDGHEEVTKVTLPTSIKEIKYGAFANCKNLTKVEGAQGLQTIRSAAFEHCEKLEFTIPASVQRIYNSAFFCDNKALTVKGVEGNKYFFVSEISASFVDTFDPRGDVVDLSLNLDKFTDFLIQGFYRPVLNANECKYILVKPNIDTISQFYWNAYDEYQPVKANGYQFVGYFKDQALTQEISAESLDAIKDQDITEIFLKYVEE